MTKHFKEVALGLLECPECGSHNVEINCNMFNNLYTCTKCGFQET